MSKVIVGCPKDQGVLPSDFFRSVPNRTLYKDKSNVAIVAVSVMMTGLFTAD